MKLLAAFNNVNLVRLEADPALEISGISCDSRRVRPGYLFAAVPGFKTDGHDFVPQARERGAVAALTGRWLEGIEIAQAQTDNVRLAMALAAANFYGHPSRKMSVVGVTGTNGKTTTTFLIDAILRAWGILTGLVGGIHYKLGERLLPAMRTTPESVDLQRMLAVMAKGGVRAAVIEVSSHGIELYRVAHIDFDVAVFTNLTREHLDLHGSMENYFAAKRRLLVGSLGDAKATAISGKRPIGIINIDDSYGRRLAGELDDAIRFGLSPGAKVTAKNVQAKGWETSFDLVTPSGAAPVRLRLPGAFNLSNALAAAGAAYALGTPTGVIAQGLEVVRGVPGRFELVDLEAPFKVVVDYAHNEDGLAKSLGVARDLTQAKLIVVFGCPGERDRDKRPEMGRVAGTLSDQAILTTDDCYGEPPEQITSEAEPGLVESGADYLKIMDRRRAIESALKAAGPGDTVLIAGKGHEAVQIMAGGPLPFSDSQVVREIMEKK